MLKRTIPVTAVPGRCAVLPTGIIIEFVVPILSAAFVVGVPVPISTVSDPASTTNRLAIVSPDTMKLTSAPAELIRTCPLVPVIVSPDTRMLPKLACPAVVILPPVTLPVALILPGASRLPLLVNVQVLTVAPPVPTSTVTLPSRFCTKLV